MTQCQPGVLGVSASEFTGVWVARAHYLPRERSSWASRCRKRTVVSMSRSTIDFGIHLGITHASIAVIEGMDVHSFKNSHYEERTPCAIYLDARGRFFVGRSATERTEVDPDNTRVEFQRDMGTPVQYTFVNSGRVLTPEECSAEVLKSLKRDVQQHLDEEVRCAVITVPAMVGLPACDATRRAAKLAGIDCAPLLQEPIAAAIAYAFRADTDRAFGLVYDLSRDTFDVSLVAVRDGRLTVVDHDGDNRLGSNNFDWLLVEKWVLPHLQQQYALATMRHGNVHYYAALAKLKAACEQAKIELSQHSSAMILLEELCEDDVGQVVEVDLEVPQEAYRQLIAPQVLRTIHICQKVLQRNNLTPRSIDLSVLVGGPTLTPCIREMLQSELGIALDVRVDPITVVARGAAIFAGRQPLPKVYAQRRGGPGEFPVALQYPPLLPELAPSVGGPDMRCAPSQHLNYGRASMADHLGDCAPLLELATPHLYRRNLFRVLGVPVYATAQDVQRQQRRRQIEISTTGASTAGPGGPLALDPAPTDEDCQTAIERLRDPFNRLLDEVFWFWPTTDNGATDPALQALAMGQAEHAAELWTAQTSQDGAGHIATHNLAVLEHLLALDAEARRPSEKLDKEHETSLVVLWARAFARWRAVLDGEGFWSVLRHRVHGLNDRQLTTGLVRRIRDTLPTALLLINAKIAYSAAERCEAALAQRHIRLLRGSKLGEGLADEAIREALTPLRNRLTTAIARAKSRWASTPQHGQQEVCALHSQATSLLAIVDTLVPADHLVRAGLHDLVAEAMLEGQVAYGKKTDDWPGCITLLELAQAIAVGESVQARLVENLTILRENAASGNDWYAPGYWELPAETVAQLEAAEAMTQAGNYDGAIHALAGLDPQIGKPLRRCLAYSLSRKGIRICNEALDDYNADTEILSKLLRKLRSMDEAELRLALLRRPNPNSYRFMKPDCLCCGRSYYTRWIEFTYKDIPLFMCDSCSDTHKAQSEQQKRTLRPRLSTALEYLLLAEEVDPGDAGVRRNVQSVQETARNVHCTIPTTEGLKRQFGGEKTRSTRRTFAPSPADTVCFFCGASTADDSCSITVPMCGDLQPVTLLFYTRIEYQYADIVIPRCRRCRDQHSALPGCLEQWHAARVAADDDTHFSDILTEIQSAEAAVRTARARVPKHQQQVAAARAALRQAEAVGEQCDRCHSKTFWEPPFCRQCDQQVFQFGALAKGAVAGTIALSLAAIWGLHAHLGVLTPFAEFVAFQSGWSVHEAGQYVPLIASGVLPLVCGLTLAGGLKQRQLRRRRALRQQQAEEILQRRNTAVAEAKTTLAPVQAAFDAAAKAAQPLTKAHAEAQNKLQTAKAQAVANFERVSPKPELPTGVQPEDTYLNFGRIQRLRERGWGFGHQPAQEGKQVNPRPVDVEGLVASAPRG